MTREVCETCGALKNRNGPQDVMERNLWRFGISKAGDPREEEPSGSKHRS